MPRFLAKIERLASATTGERLVREAERYLNRDARAARVAPETVTAPGRPAFMPDPVAGGGSRAGSHRAEAGFRTVEGRLIEKGAIEGGPTRGGSGGRGGSSGVVVVRTPVGAEATLRPRRGVAVRLARRFFGVRLRSVHPGLFDCGLGAAGVVALAVGVAASASAGGLVGVAAAALSGSSGAFLMIAPACVSGGFALGFLAAVGVSLVRGRFHVLLLERLCATFDARPDPVRLPALAERMQELRSLGARPFVAIRWNPRRRRVRIRLYFKVRVGGTPEGS